MRETRACDCPYCGDPVPFLRLGRHVKKCPNRHKGLVLPPADVIAADADWFARYPNSWRLRRRITEGEKASYREMHKLAPDVPISGCVVVLKPYRYDDPRDLYSYRGVRAEGVSDDAEGQ